MMKDTQMDIKRRTVTKEIVEITFNGFKTELYELVELIEKLRQYKDGVPPVIIRNEKLSNKLEELGVLCTTQIGYSYIGRNYQEFRNMLNKALSKDLKCS